MQNYLEDKALGMTVRILLDVQRKPCKQEIKGWGFRDRAPFLMRNFDEYDASKNYLFVCKDCGSTEFNSASESNVECDSCSARYVVAWTN